MGAAARPLVIVFMCGLGLARDRVGGRMPVAVDYLAKPFDVDELLARLRALRRGHSGVSADLRCRLDVRGPRASCDRWRGDQACPTVSAPLLLVEDGRPRWVFSRAELVSEVFPTPTMLEEILDTYVHYLRRKLSRDVIRTVRGLGYQLGSRVAS